MTPVPAPSPAPADDLAGAIRLIRQLADRLEAASPPTDDSPTPAPGFAARRLRATVTSIGRVWPEVAA